jgi:hypothetical protein
LLLAVVLICGLAVPGCRESPPVVSAPTTPPAEVAEPVAAQPVASHDEPAPVVNKPEQPSESEPSPLAADDPVAADTSTTVTTEVETKSEEVASTVEGESTSTTEAAQTAEAVSEVESPAPPRERVLLLTQDGPLVIDIQLSIDGEPPTAAFERVVDSALSAADNDGDGQASWTETLDNPRFAYGQFGNLAPEDESQRSQVIEMYDNNRNGLVERAELPRFITRNAGGSRSFSLTSSNEFRGDNRSRSPIRRVLDVDHDGAITEGELAGAVNRLLERDADDDEILTLADIKDEVE